MPRCPTCHRRIPEGTPCPADGDAAPPWVVPEDVANAKRPVIPGFTILGHLGMGGFSIVWKAARELDTDSGSPRSPTALGSPGSPGSLESSGAPGVSASPGSARRVFAAIKVARGDSAVVVERFRRDAEALAKIGPPSVPRLYASGRLDDGFPFIAMELLSGRPLSDHLEELPGPPDTGWVVRIALAVLDAISAAHQKGFLHRDLKPENIFLDERGRRATLIDFGLTKPAARGDIADITRTGTVVGTPEYMAPEQIRGEESIDARADIYAFGVILYELFTLRVPFVGDRASVEHGHVALRPPRLRELVTIPEPLEELVLACLAKEPGRRPADVDVIRRALLEIAPPSLPSSVIVSSGPTSSGTLPASRPASSKSRLLAEARRPMVILVVETNAAVLPVTSAVARYGGFIARQRASGYVCVFSGVDVEDPARAGISAAREMVTRFGARAALHVASLAMRRQENSPPAVYGAPVERPETWMPKVQGWIGAVLTADISRIVAESELGAPLEDGAFLSLVLGAPLSDGAPSLPWDTDPFSMAGLMPRGSGPVTEPMSARSSRGRSLSTSAGLPALSPPAGQSTIPPPPTSQIPWSKPWVSPLSQPPSAPPPTQVSASPPATERSPRTVPVTELPPPGSISPGYTEENAPSSQPMTRPSQAVQSMEPADSLFADTTVSEDSSSRRPSVNQSGTRERLPLGNESAVRPADPRFRAEGVTPGGSDSSRAPPLASGLSSLSPLSPSPSAPVTEPPSESPTERGDGMDSIRRGWSGPASSPGPTSSPAPASETPGTLRPGEPMTKPSMSPPAPSRPSSSGNLLAQRVPVFGRNTILELMTAGASASFEGACPGLFTLLGESGLGKTRLAGEALGVVDKLRPGAAVIFQRAAQPLADAAGQTTRILLARVLGVPGAEPFSGGLPRFVEPADPRAFCRDRLGEELGEETYKAVSVTLGWGSAEALSVSPGAAARGAMLALSEGLRRLSRDGPVALILDDAHWADDTALDAIEYATLNAEGCPLWVLVAAHPRFESVRRGWGSRAQRHDRVVLEPLDEAAGMELAAELLLPAEYPPAATLKRLSDWAGGNPACLAELARTLKRAGIVRQRPNLGTWYVATAELDRLPPSTAWQWLAVRQLDGLAPELAACVRLCAVMGVDFDRAEVEWVQDVMEREGASATPMDMGVGLGSLVERRILLRGAGDRYLFQSSTFQDAVYKLLDGKHRETIHRVALQYWRLERERGVDAARVLDRLARHAGACGAREEAAEAYLALGDAARERHKHVEADQHYTSALMFLSEEDTRRRALALGGRGKIRYRVHRIVDALDDLRQARELATGLGDKALTADLLLEEATVHDFANEYAASAQCVEDARAYVDQLADPRLELRFGAALGRSHFRHERMPEAIDVFQKVVDRAKETGDYETRVISLLLLGPALVAAGSLDEADRRFQEVLSICTEAEDRLHLGAAYANRAYLWVARKLRDRCMEDLRRAIQLAREVGNPFSECIATSNVAEFLHWLGEVDEALLLARRVLVLEERFIENPVPTCSLLLARIHAVRGDYAETQKRVEWVSAHCVPTDSEPATLALYQAMCVLLAHVGVATSNTLAECPSWDAIVERASRGVCTEELLEVLYWRARLAIERARWDEAADALKQVDAHLDECSMWPLRFANLDSRLQLHRPPSTPPGGRAANDLS